MKLIYLTAKRFPASTADHIYVQSLAKAFAGILGNGFELVISGLPSPELSGIRVRSVPAPRRLRSLYYFFWFPDFARSLVPGTVIFSNDQNLLAIAIFWRFLLRAKYRICSDWHQLTGTWKDAFVARRSDALIATSETLKKKISEAASIDSERIHAVYGGVDPDPYRKPLPSRAELGLPEGKYLVGYVGLFKTMGFDKGLGTMIDALAFLPPDVSLAFVGGSLGEIAEYAASAREHGVLGRCIFIERVPAERVASYERSMDALVIPYPDEPHFRDYGFPMKTYEYLASGRPIVYSDLDIISEVLKGKGISFSPGNAASLADAIRSVRLASQGVAHENAAALERYSWEAKAKTIIVCISSAASEPVAGVSAGT